jgi:uncharacterized protein (UPF0332 family)
MNNDDIKSLITYRLGQADVALEDAKILMEQGRSTMTIVNRSYYAMFYSLLALLQTTGKISSKHSVVISFFDREYIKTGIFPKEMSKAIHDAFDLRQEADYEVITPPEPTEVSEIWYKAKDFVDKIRAYLIQSGHL